MTSQHQLRANRKNSASSTGPRTEHGKARSSQNAVRHGLAKKFGQEAAELRNIQNLAELIASERQDISHATAHAAAKAELELVHIRKVRAEAWSLVAESVEGGLVGSIADAINKAESTERYEKRAISRKKKIVRRMRVTE
jgi:hypothetical protein